MDTHTGFEALYGAIEHMIQAHTEECRESAERGACSVIIALSAIQAHMCAMALSWLDKSQEARRN